MMDQSNASSEEELVQLADLVSEDKIVENIKTESVPFEFVEPEAQECVVCVARSFESFDINTTQTAASGTSLHSFLSRFTNTELPFCSEFVRYICKTCLDLVNVLDRAEQEYLKLRADFHSIIRKNPLFCLPPQDNLDCLKIDGDDSEEETNKKEERDIRNEDIYNGEFASGEDPMNYDINLFVPRTLLAGIEQPFPGPFCMTPSQLNMNLPDDNGQSKDGASSLGLEPEIIIKTGQKLTNRKRKPPGEKFPECPICKRQILRKYFAEHIRSHTGEKPFECSFCKRRFSRKGNLQDHIRTHTGEKRFECEICHRNFYQNYHLQSHLRTHTGEKPHQCQVCEVRFTHKENLQRHLKTHTGEMPHECKVCHRRFNRKAHLDIHERTHTGEKPFECTICNQRYNQKSHLRIHLKMHSGAKLHECEICQRQFEYKHNLQTHLRTHTGEKPFECMICHQRFGRNDHLQRHVGCKHAGSKE